jgi:hypothetical protein
MWINASNSNASTLTTFPSQSRDGCSNHAADPGAEASTITRENFTDFISVAP